MGRVELKYSVMRQKGNKFTPQFSCASDQPGPKHTIRDESITKNLSLSRKEKI